MNREQISLEDAVGLTLEGVIENTESTHVLLAFSSGKFAMVRGRMTYSDEAVVDHDSKVEFYRTAYSPADLSRVFDAETISAWEQEDNARRERRKREEAERERQQFERLRAKFGT